ncbi:MAG: OsmC family protein [Rubrivivax sp.]|nr:OsmC family protein [Rubrivivax sp.]
MSPVVVVQRERAHKMKHSVRIRQHAFATDEPPGNGGEDLGATPHEIHDAALGSCKALTVLWFAQRRQMPLQDIRVTVERDDSEERQGIYRLRVVLELDGPGLTEAQRQQLLAVAEKCPLHKLMTQVKTEIRTELEPRQAAG